MPVNSWKNRASSELLQYIDLGQPKSVAPSGQVVDRKSEIGKSLNEESIAGTLQPLKFCSKITSR